MGQASEEVILSVVQVGHQVKREQKTAAPETDPPKTQKARQRSQTPASGTGGADRKTTTTCTPRDAEMAAGAVDQDIDGNNSIVWHCILRLEGNASQNGVLRCWREGGTMHGQCEAHIIIPSV